jgi:hypothetical protein
MRGDLVEKLKVFVEESKSSVGGEERDCFLSATVAAVRRSWNGIKDSQIRVLWPLLVVE